MLRLFRKIARLMAVIGAAASAAASVRQHRQPDAADLERLGIPGAELRGVRI